jgi:hypothetical protein
LGFWIQDLYQCPSDFICFAAVIEYLSPNNLQRTKLDFLRVLKCGTSKTQYRHLAWLYFCEATFTLTLFYLYL